MIISQGNPLYEKYWNQVEADRESHVVGSVKEGFEKLEKGQIVLHATSGILRGAIKSDPKSAPEIMTFGAKKSTYYNAVFTKDSPLVPIFMKAVTQTFENGQYDHIALNWQGGEIISSGTVDLMVLSPGQVFLIFGVLMSMLTCCLICLVFECMYFYVLKRRLLLWGPIHPKISIVKHKVSH